MRIERVYDWKKGAGLIEVDPTLLDPAIQASGTTRVGHLSDTHLGKGDRKERRRHLEDWLRLFQGLRVEGIIHSGDLVEDPRDESEVRWALDRLDEIDVPLLGVPGNHDVVEPGEETIITRRWGPFPRREEIGALQVWLLDSMRAPSVGERDEREKRSARASGFYSRGALGREQLEKLRGEMEKGEGAQILVVHHHLRQPVPAKPWYEENGDLMAPLEEADDLLDLARRKGVRMILHGHRHQYVTPFMPVEDLVIVNASSATHEAWPKRARVLDIGSSGESVRIWEVVRFA